MATEFSLESVRQYMLAHEGKVTNHDLVKYYKAWLTHPIEKDSARQRFKEYVNTLSTIKIENGIKFLVLKKRFYPSFATEPTPQNMVAQASGSSPSLLDEVMLSYQSQYQRPRRELPQVPISQSISQPISQPIPPPIPPSYRQPPQLPPTYRQPPPPPPNTSIQTSYNRPPDLGLPLPSDYGLPAPRQGLFHPPGPASLTNYEMRTSPQQHHPYISHQQSQGNPQQHQYYPQVSPSQGLPPYTRKPSEQPPPPPQMSRSSSVMSSYHSSYDLGSSRSVSVSSSRPSLYEDSTPPPPLPTRNNTVKEPSPPLSMASSSSSRKASLSEDSSRKTSLSENSSRKASLSEDKENQEQLLEKAKQEKISVKERTKTFNRMASEVEVTNLLKVANNVSNNHISSSSISSNDKKRKNSRANRGSSSHRDDLDSHDSSSISTLDHVSKQWMVSAAKCDYLSLVKMLRDDPRLAKSKDFITGYTALHWAAKHGNLDLVKLLAGNYQVDVNVKSHGGYTPLHLACQFGHQEVFDILVKAYGADPNTRDNAGKKPRQYMQLTTVNAGQGGLHMSSDTFRQLKDRRRHRNRQLADKNSGILRFGSLSVKVKKTTEAFNNYFGHHGNDKKSSSEQPYSLPMIGVGQDEDSAKMPPPKLGPIKKRKSKRAADFSNSVSISKSAPVTPHERSPIKEEKHSDSDSEYGFDSGWNQS